MVTNRSRCPRAHFNPSLVRLARLWLAVQKQDDPDFNPSLVRLARCEHVPSTQVDKYFNTSLVRLTRLRSA